MVGGLTTVIWSVVDCCSGRWLNNRNLVGGRLLFWSVVGGFSDRWSDIFWVSGRWYLVGGRVGVTVVSGLVHVPNFEGVSGSEDRGGGDNSIQFINIGRVGDKSYKKWRRKIGGGRVGDNNILTFYAIAIF